MGCGICVDLQACSGKTDWWKIIFLITFNHFISKLQSIIEPQPWWCFGPIDSCRRPRGTCFCVGIAVPVCTSLEIWFWFPLSSLSVGICAIFGFLGRRWSFVGSGRGRERAIGARSSPEAVCDGLSKARGSIRILSGERFVLGYTRMPSRLDSLDNLF